MEGFMDFFAVWVPTGMVSLGSTEEGTSFNLLIDHETPKCRYLVGQLTIPENYAKTDWKLFETHCVFIDPASYVTLDSPNLPKWEIPNKDVDTGFKLVNPPSFSLPLKDSVNWLLTQTVARCEELFMTEVHLVCLNQLEVPPHLNALERCWKGLTGLFR